MANEQQNGIKSFRKWRRRHGLQPPLHPQQIISWIFLLTFTLYTFLSLLPTIHTSAQLPLLVLCSLVFGIHYVSHLTALLTDPSDPNLLALYSNKPVPPLDRTKYSHVIENGRCNLCNIVISSTRTKHCSVCNKCVHVFDHHCKWLNQCIGKRNYKSFFISVASSICMAIVFVVVASVEIVFYLTSRNLLAPWQHFYDTDNVEDNQSEIYRISNSSLGISMKPFQPKSNQSSHPKEDQMSSINSTFSPNAIFPVYEEMFVIFLAPVADKVFIPLTLLLGVLALLCAGLLIHLCIFHIYINVHNITTYEYVRAQRDEIMRERREAIGTVRGPSVAGPTPGPAATPIAKCSPAKNCLVFKNGAKNCPFVNKSALFSWCSKSKRRVGPSGELDSGLAENGGVHPGTGSPLPGNPQPPVTDETILPGEAMHSVNVPEPELLDEGSQTSVSVPTSGLEDAGSSKRDGLHPALSSLEQNPRPPPNHLPSISAAIQEREGVKKL